MRCWDGHNTAHTPDEMHQSSGEGTRRDHGSVAWAGAEGPGRQWHKAWQQAEAGPTVSLSPARPPVKGKSGLGPFVLGGLSQEGGVRTTFTPTFLKAAPNATPLVINNSSWRKAEQRRQQ